MVCRRSLLTECVRQEIPSLTAHNDMIMYRNTVVVEPPFLMHPKITHRSSSRTGIGLSLVK